MEIKNIKWNRVNHGPIKEPLLDYLELLVDRLTDEGLKLKVCIGTDSQKKNKGYKFATAILIEMSEPMGEFNGVMTYIGRGAKVISGTFMDNNRMYIKERMLKEVQVSVDTGYYLLDLIELYDIDLEIHADVNPDPMTGSNVALKDALGFITGMGFTCRVKPLAYAASSGADRLCQ